MPRPEPARGPGRPPSGARERVLEAGLDVLKQDGYAGLTTAKVAARAGQNKALIAYHFGSKQGLVAAVGREVAESITAEVLRDLGEPETVDGVVAGVLDGLWRVLDEDERLARLYFDLSAVSIVEPEVRAVMSQMRAMWRSTLAHLLASTSDGPHPRRAEALAVWLMAAIDGLALERIQRGETPELRQARAMLLRSAPQVAAAER